MRGKLARFGIRVTVFAAPHTQTELGTRTEFRDVTSLPVEYVARELVHAIAIDTAPRRHAASPVYRLLRLAAWFPTFMERKMVECVQHLFRDHALPSPDGEPNSATRSASFE